MTGQAPDFADKPPIGKNLRSEMDRIGITIDALAREMPCSERLIRRWRDGDFAPAWPNLVRLAEVFGREPGWFYTDPDQVAA